MSHPMLPSVAEIMVLSGLRFADLNGPPFLRSEPPPSLPLVTEDPSGGASHLFNTLPAHSVCWKGKVELYHASLDGRHYGAR